MRELTRPEFKDDFAPRLDALPAYVCRSLGLTPPSQQISAESLLHVSPCLASLPSGPASAQAGGGDDEGRCALLVLSTLIGLPSTRAVLGGALHLTDLQRDYKPRGTGPALSRLKHALGAGAPPAVKMLLGCRAWAEEAELEEQLRMGLWRLVEPIEGGQKLGAALMRAHETPDAAFALWEALWAKTEQEQEATGA